MRFNEGLQTVHLFNSKCLGLRGFKRFCEEVSRGFLKAR